MGSIGITEWILILFSLAFVVGLPILILKLRKKKVTFLKVLGLGVLCYLGLVVLFFILFVIGDLL
jgi:hypothetical protein